MMSIEEFISFLVSKDIRMILNDEKLKLNYPKNALTDDIREELVKRKDDIVSYLKNTNSDNQDEKITPVKKKSEYCLSFEQERLWFLDKFIPWNSAYSNSVAWKIKGNINISYLKQSLQDIVNRHDSLRSTFDMVDGNLVQRINDHEELTFRLVDLSQKKDIDVQEEADRLIVEEFKTPMDLKNGPLFRVLLVKIKDEEFLLEINPHHIISDGWSWNILFKELRELYLGYVNGKKVCLKPLEIQYVDFAEWQKHALTGSKLEKNLTYWKENLEGAPELLKLPYDFKRPKLQTYEGKRRYIELSDEITKKIKNICTKNGISLYMTLLSFVNLLFYAYTGSNDICIGTAVANRNKIEVEDIFGFFVNTLVLRNKINENITFNELLSNVKTTCANAFSNQEMPFEKLVEELNVSRDTSYSPLIQTMFVLQDTSEADLKIDGLDIESYNFSRGTIRFDLEIYLWEENNKIKGYFEYNTSLFKLDTIERMIDNFKYILDYVPDNMKKPIKELTLLSPKEYKKVVYDYNDTNCTYSENNTLYEAFEENAIKQPNNIAISTEKKEVSYFELNSISNKLSNLLLSKGSEKGDLVAISMDRSIEMIQGILGILKTGGVYVPFEPNLPKDRIHKMLSNSKLKIIITDSNHLDMFLDISKELDNIKYIIVVDSRIDNKKLGNVEILDKDDMNDKSDENPNLEISSDMNAYIIFTSGSTGNPKGVVVKHKSAVNLIEWVNKTYNINPSDKELFVTSIGFDLSVYDVFGILSAGATIRLVEKDDLGEPKNLLDIIENENITFWDSAPQKLQQVAPFFKEIDLQNRKSALKHVFLSGDWIPLSLPIEVKKYFNEAQVTSLGGATEATIWSNYYDIEAVESDWVSIPYGKPIQNARYYILDKNLKPCPIGVSGDLYIGGKCLAVEYINDPKLTNDKFIKNPFIEGEKMYKTGDVAKWHEDGNMQFMGRSDFQVKIRGYRIELGDIENCLLKAEHINEVVVKDIEENGMKYLCAYYVSDEEYSTNDLKDILKQKLPDYMIPSYFIKLNKVPITTNGKIDRKALPVPKKEIESNSVYEEPTDEVEKKILNIWKESLNIDKIGINDDFFILGGQSLLAAEVIEKINSEFKVHVLLKEIFYAPTIKQLAKYLTKNMDSINYTQIDIPRVEEADYYDISFSQDYVLQRRNSKKVTAFNEARVYEVNGKLDYNKVEETFWNLIERQEALRTKFKKVNNKIVQIIEPIEKVDFKVKIIEEHNEEKIKDLINNFVRVFDVSKAPLFSVQIIKISEEKNIFMFNVDHVIFDASSLNIFIKEFCSLYKGETLEELKTRYRDFSDWNRKLVLKYNKDEINKYWDKEYPTKVTPVDLPKDYKIQEGVDYRGIDKIITIDTKITKKLKQLSREYGATLYMMLQTYIKLLIFKETGEKDISIGTAAVGRKNKSLLNIIGVFFNMISIRTMIDENMTFKELVYDIKKKSLEGMQYSEYPAIFMREKMGGINPFKIILLWEESVESEFNIDGLNFKRLPLDYENSGTAMYFSVKEKDDMINIRISYPEQLYKKDTINRFEDDLNYIIQNTIENPDIQLSNIR